MYELAAEAQAFKDRNPGLTSGAGRFWTDCFLRLARCHLAAPAGLTGSPAGSRGLEGEALTQLLNGCSSSYGDDTLRGDARAISDAVGRLLEDNGFDLGLLVRLVVGVQAYSNVAAGLLCSVLAALRRPGVRARAQAQLATAQAGVPPERRLTFDQLELLFAKMATLKHPDAPLALAALRCRGDGGWRLLAVCGGITLPAIGWACMRVSSMREFNLPRRSLCAGPPRRCCSGCSLTSP
jgi:hypothetical protein